MGLLGYYGGRIRGLAGFAVLALGLASICSASYALEKGRYSESEKAGFAFYKLAKSEPDFEKWILGSERYYEAKPRRKIELMQSDLYRLESGFLHYMPDIDLLNLQVEATIEASQFYAQSQNSDALTEVKIDLTGLPDNYFPFQIGDMWIAIVIKNFDLMTQMTFNKDEYRDFIQGFNLQMNAYQLRQKVNIDLKLRPVSVDTSSPVKMEGIDMWLMLAEIADMQFWRGNQGGKQYLWHYTAPWYISDQHLELLRLQKR